MGGMVHEERDVGDLLVDGHPVLRPEIMLAQEITVIGRDDQCCVLPQVMGIEFIDHLAEKLVAKGEERIVIGAHLIRFLI